MQRTTFALILGAVVILAGCHYSDYSVAYHDKNTHVHVEKRSYVPPPPPPPPPPVYYERHEYHHYYHH